MCAYHYKDQCPLTHHTRSQRAALTSSTLSYTVQDPVSPSVLSTIKHRNTSVVCCPCIDRRVHCDLFIGSTFSLNVPRTRPATRGDRTFTNAAATPWNSLPPGIRNSDKCFSFQRPLKTFSGRCMPERILRLPALFSFN